VDGPLHNLDVLVVDSYRHGDAPLRKGLLYCSGEADRCVNVRAGPIALDQRKQRNRLVVSGHSYPAVAAVVRRGPVARLRVRDRRHLARGFCIEFEWISKLGIGLGSSLGYKARELG